MQQRTEGEAPRGWSNELEEGAFLEGRKGGAGSVFMKMPSCGVGGHPLLLVLWLVSACQAGVTGGERGDMSCPVGRDLGDMAKGGMWPKRGAAPASAKGMRVSRRDSMFDQITLEAGGCCDGPEGIAGRGGGFRCGGGRGGGGGGGGAAAAAGAGARGGLRGRKEIGRLDWGTRQRSKDSQEGRRHENALHLRGGFKNMFGEEQCTNSSRGEADHARNQQFNREFEKAERRVNETALQEYEEFEREVRNAEFQKEIEIDEKTRHVLPRDWRTNKRWASNLRACCMCGMLKTQDMWLDYGCDNCPFLLPPGSSDVDRVEGATTALWKGMFTVIQEAEEMKKSNIIRDKYPRGLLTASKMPAKGLYCLGFFRALNPHLQAELARRGIDPSPLLFNNHSRPYLNYSYDDEIVSGDREEDSDLSGFIDDTPRDKWGNPIETAELVDEEDEREEEEEEDDEINGVLGKREREDSGVLEDEDEEDGRRRIKQGP